MKTNIEKIKPVLSVDEIKYFVNEDKRTVTCLATFKLKNFIGSIWNNYMNINSRIREILKRFNVDFNIHSETFTISKTAKCSKDDVFDVELGKKIAESKVMLFALKNHKFLIKELTMDFFNIAKRFDNYACIYAEKLNKEGKHYEFLVSQVKPLK